MAKVYADLIRKGRKTLNDVPEILRAEVEAILGENANAAGAHRTPDTNKERGG